MWQEKDKKLYKKFNFLNFDDAILFINQVAEVARQMDHHPRIHNTASTVEVWLSTHEAGDIVTELDNEMAKRIDLIQKQPNLSASTTQHHPVVKLYADGGSRGNPGPSASGFVLMDEKGDVIKKSGIYLGITTNNQAEYHSLKLGLEEALKLSAHEVNVFMDSLLVINQMKGIYKIKNRDLWPIYEAIKLLTQHFKKITFTHIPRELNKLADGEVNETLDAELKA
jgi:ribonuclease HI/pterin-4a-carbinolamine dehydratase